MRLLVVTQDFPPATGGIQTYAWELCRRLASRCDALHLVCPAAEDAAVIDASCPFPVHRIGGPNALPLRGAPTITKLIAQHQIDVLFHVQWQTAAAGALLRRLGVISRLAIAVHGKELLLRPLRVSPWAQRQYDRMRANILSAADVLLPVSRFSQQLLPEGVAKGDCVVVSNGVDARRFDGGDGHRFRRLHGLAGARMLLTVSRLVRRKGIDTVIRCLPRILDEVPDAVYIVVGTGPDEIRLRDLATQHGVAQSVRFLGRVDHDELRNCYAACDAFVLAARNEDESVEGFGLVLLEAGACGQPVVATSAGGMDDAVVDQVTGFMVPPDDDGALTRAILRLLREPELARRLGQAGRHHALTSGSWERTADRIYAALASRPGTAPHQGKKCASR